MKIEINQFQIESFVDIIQNSHSVVIVPHIGPDGDAIGSCLALTGVLKSLHKEAKIVIPNEFPDFLQWIEGSDSVIDFEKQSKVAKGNPTTVMLIANLVCPLNLYHIETLNMAPRVM